MNDNIPAGAQYDSRAPWNQEDPKPKYEVLVRELWDWDNNSLGFEVTLSEVTDEEEFIDELDNWYNFDDDVDANDYEYEEVDRMIYSDYDDARAHWDGNVEFYKNDKDNG